MRAPCGLGARSIDPFLSTSNAHTGISRLSQCTRN
jgi:hypothetical protein